MKILFLLDFFSSLGGTEFYNYNFICGLRKQDIEVCVLVEEAPQLDIWEQRLRNVNVNLIFLSRKNVKESGEYYTPNVDEIIDEWKPNVIFSHPPGNMLVKYLKKNSKSEIPIVATDYTTPNNNTEHWYQPELREVINRIDTFIVKCDSEEKGLRFFHQYSGEILKIPHLIPTTYSKMIEGELESVGCVARLSPEKGVGFLLGAWKQVQKENPNATLHIYGHGKYIEYYTELVKALGLHKSVTFEGIYEPLDGINEIAKKHRIFVQPSLFESIPTAMLELLLKRKAFIASDVGGISEIINSPNNGILVEPAKTDELSEAICFLLSNPHIVDKIANASYEFVANRYDYQKSIDMYIKLFQRISK